MSENRRRVAAMHDSDLMGVFSMGAMNSLRLEALDLLDRSLAEHKAMLLEGFVERQLSIDPPPIELLSQIGEDLHQRLMVLRQSHFDVRDNVLKTVRMDFGVDLSPLVPPNTLQNYHLLRLDDALGYLMLQNTRLTDEECAGLRKILQSSLDKATQLHQEMIMAEQLYDFVTDWVMGLHVMSVRHAWTSVSELDNRQTQ